MATYKQYIEIIDVPTGAAEERLAVEEWNLYGSSRLGVYSKEEVVASRIGVWNGSAFVPGDPPTYTINGAPAVNLVFNEEVGHKNYELTNHLGNVLATITDRKVPSINGTSYDYFNAQITSIADYYPFGMQIEERSWTATNNKYRFGFNGKEKDDETKGDGNSLDFGARIYDSRLGRWLSIDPHWDRYPGISPYNFSFDSPLMFNDPDGKDGRITVTDATNADKRNGITGGRIVYTTVVHLYGANASAARAALIQNQWNAMNNTADVIIDKKVWQITVNVQFVYNQQLDNAVAANRAAGNLGANAFPATSDYIGTGGIINGDNILELDNTLTNAQMGGNAATGLVVNTSTGKVRSPVNTPVIHETGHFLGFDERYNPQFGGIVNAHPGFGPNGPGQPNIWDFMTNANPAMGQIEFSTVHFYDLVTRSLTATGRMGIGGVRPTGPVLNGGVLSGLVDNTIGGTSAEPYVDSTVNDPVDTVVEKKEKVQNPR